MPPKQWNNLKKILERNGPFVLAGFEPDDSNLQFLAESKILVVGAGGLGCEMLKDLSMMGWQNIHVIDCDIIEISNLNRQFLFRTKDVGRSKAVVAAEFIMARVPSCKVVPHFCRIEDKPTSFYMQFNMIVSGLDAIAPRRWLNSLLFGLWEQSENDLDSDGDMEINSTIPMIDGGTEGFKGNVRMIIPGTNTPCIECTLDLYPPQVTYPMCTLTTRPRLPEHCIEYVKLILWPKEQPFGEQTKLDVDDPVHLQWIYEKALERANEYGIEGVNYRLAQGVIKNIIPAVASTNATIAAACVNEAFKLMTLSAPMLNNYFVYNNSDGIYTYTYEAERKPECPVCGYLPVSVNISQHCTLKEFMDVLQTEHGIQTGRPTLTTTMQNGQNKTLYMAMLDEQTKQNLDKTLHALELVNNQLIVATALMKVKKFILKFT